VIEKLARRAWVHGRSPERYRRLAGKAADVAWIFVAMSLFVWLFAGWAWALIALALALGAFGQSVAAKLIGARLQELYDMTGKKPTDSNAG